MRERTLIVLGVLIISILAPVSFDFSPAVNGTFLLAFDVCSAGAHALSSNSESSCIFESPLALRIFETTSSATIPKIQFKPLLFAIQKDRPPQS
jgi:hypothetical protein